MCLPFGNLSDLGTSVAQKGIQLDLNMAGAIKQRLWVVCEPFYPEENATSYYLTEIAAGLADDYDVRVICSQPTYSSRGIRAPKRETHKGVSIHRIWSTTLDKNILPFRLANIFTIGASTFLKSLRSFRRGDKVLVVTGPPNLPYTTALAALFKGSHYNVIIQDLYPDILVALNRLRKNSSMVSLIDRMNRWLYKHASRLVVMGRDMEERVGLKASGLDVRIACIPNWADLEAISPEPRSSNPLLIDLGISERFVITFAGNVGHAADLETIVEAAQILADDPSVHFVFVGAGGKKPWLDREVVRRGLINVSICGQLPRSEQRVFLNACDVGIISLIPGMLGCAMPSRSYNVLAAGKPIIALAEEGSELEQVTNEERVGWCIPPGDPERLVATIREAMRDRGRLDEMGRRARAAAVEKYSPKIAIDRYREALK